MKQNILTDTQQNYRNNMYEIYIFVNCIVFKLYWSSFILSLLAENEIRNSDKLCVLLYACKV